MESLLLPVVLGIVQGVAEWLPISSEGVLVLIGAQLGGSIDELVRQALFFHLGTFIAALVYFWRDVVKVFKTLFGYNGSSSDERKIFWFLVVSTLVGGALGGLLFVFLVSISGILSGQILTILVGVLLLITAFLQFRAKNYGNKLIKDLRIKEGILLGILQGISVLPGISRSGITISGFLLRGFDKTVALRLSFLMSLPAVFGANIVLNLSGVSFSIENFISLFFAFIFGLLTIHGLIKLSYQINFFWFVLIFGILAIVAGILV